MEHVTQGFRHSRTTVLLSLALVVAVVLGRDSIVDTLYGQAAPAETQPQYTFAPSTSVSKLTTQFLYQGSLAVSGEAANGAFNFRVRLFNAETGGEQIGPENSFDGIELTGGTFSMYLDYGDVFNGEMRWLEIDVQGEGEEAFTTLTPRQGVNPVPYALYAESTLETWQMGGLATDSSSGVMIGGRFYYQSYDSENEPFPDPLINFVEVALVPKQVERLFVIGKGTGEYEGQYNLSFQVRGFDGSFRRTASAQPLNLNELSVGTDVNQLIELPVTTNPEDRIVYPGEYLAVYVSREGEAGGNLLVHLSSYAMVRNAVLPDTENNQ